MALSLAAVMQATNKIKSRALAPSIKTKGRTPFAGRQRRGGARMAEGRSAPRALFG